MIRSAASPLERCLASCLRQSRMLTPGDCVGVAVSGGGDSVALLRLLVALQGELGVTLRVLHFHHSLRGPEADADAEFVAGLARACHLEFVFEQKDVAAIARENRWNLEDAARRLRYSFFDRLASSGRVTRVAVAHTADDQAETVLAHLLRGTGTRGLAAIHPVAGCVVRPLLSFHRSELHGYLESIGQPWREDFSNLDTTRTRARIRARLLPLLESEFSPRVVEHLGNLARLAREEETFWDAIAGNCLRAYVQTAPDGFSISVADLLAPLPLSSIMAMPQGKNFASSAVFRPLTQRLIRCLYKQVRGDLSALTAHHVAQVIALAEDSSSGRLLQLPHGVEVEKSFADMYFRLRQPSVSDADEFSAHSSRTCPYEYSVALPGRGETSVSIPEIGTCVKLKVIDWPLPERETKKDSIALDADLLCAPLVLRNWRPGDAYRPRGHRQPRKLKQLFLAQRVPLWERMGWPVLESAGHVAWALGFPPAADFTVRRETRTGVLIEESRV